jgi:hypothetical protein
MTRRRRQGGPSVENVFLCNVETNVAGMTYLDPIVNKKKLKKMGYVFKGVPT